MFPTILIVDDEPSILQSLEGLLTDEGFTVFTASNGYEALKITESESPDLVLLDIWMPGLDGIETLKELKKENPYISVVMITGHGTIETAIQATKFGAFDFIEKPLSIDKIIVAINNALNFRKLEEENRYLRKKTLEKHSINGTSAAIQKLNGQIFKIAPTESSILIMGENGTGKELLARTIHHMSKRAEEPFIIVNCAAIPEDLIESELFGHEKGTFSDSTARNRGKFELATGGTIFLDEIGDMSLKTQSKILRVLEDRKIQRAGSNRLIDINVRIIAASNKKLEHEIKEGNFREDLFFRLNGIPVKIPPLRKRIEDIPVLVDTFLEESSSKYRSDLKTIEKGAIDLLLEYAWPGNVRELKNLIDRLVIMIQGIVIKKEDIPEPYNPEIIDHNIKSDAVCFTLDNLDDAKVEFIKEFIKRKLLYFNNNISKTAEHIGIKKSLLKKQLKKYQIQL